MYCTNCGQQIPDSSSFCNICGYKQTCQLEIHIVRSVSDDQYQIAIETNDVAVVDACKQIHSEINYQFPITDTCFALTKKHIRKDPSMLYFLTKSMSDISMFKALGLPTDKILINRRIFWQKLETYLILNGYQKQPGTKVYIKNN